MAENPPAPLLAVTLVFRSKPKFLGLPHILDHVSTFLDTSVELALWPASKFGSIRLLDRIWDSSQIFEDNQPKMPENLWTLRKYIRADRHYRQFQFRLSMGEAVSRRDLEMVKWLSSKVPECKISSELVVTACKNGAKEILQFFHDNDRRVLESKGMQGVGHVVEWGGESMAAAISAHRSDIAWWLHHKFPDADFNMKAAVASALKAGDIMTAHWLVWHGAEFPSHLEGNFCFHEAAGQGRLGVLQWLNQEGKLDGIVTLLETAAENGHLDIVRWLVENDIDGELVKLGGEGSMSIHPAAINGHVEVAKFLRDKVQRSSSPAEHEHELELQLDTHEVLDELFLSKASSVSGKTMTEAAKNGHLDVVQWLYEVYGDDPYVNVFDYGEMYDRQTSVATVAMDAAANNGHLDVLKYLHKLETLVYGNQKREELTKRSPPTCTKGAMDGAATNGHLDVVKWLHENRSEGCTARAMDGAASGGHLHVVQWLFENRSEGCTSAAMDGAAANGHLEVVQWLHFNTQAGCTTVAMDRAAQNGHLEVVT